MKLKERLKLDPGDPRITMYIILGVFFIVLITVYLVFGVFSVGEQASSGENQFIAEEVHNENNGSGDIILGIGISGMIITVLFISNLHHIDNFIEKRKKIKKHE